MARAPSPSVKSSRVDISNALCADSDESEAEDGWDGFSQVGNSLPAARAPSSGMLQEEGSDDDDEVIAMTQAALNRKATAIKGRSVKKGGGFQAMGLNAHLLKAITRKGYSVPTPIQRKTMPMILAGQDVVGMARTGSGKTAAFVVPMIEKLKAHSAKVGARALITSPSRELALQTLKVVKEMSRGTDLRCVLLVGGDSLEEQFGFMASNPDIIVATPGRFLHLKVEMGLDLSSISYVVFDEADRLFEMGFSSQLSEILHALPQGRQTLLFSATLPKSLVQFAKAGLQEPSLVRLDTESKISPDLQSAFFPVVAADKDGALLHILQNVIRVPTGKKKAAQETKEASEETGKKRKRSETQHSHASMPPSEHSTVIFAATKYHVDYLASLLRLSGYAVSYVYGSLDQTARRLHIEDFRNAATNILVVTDVAARGIDVPILANVINYDFPAQPKIFVHRVGRTARAGQRGWSYSLITDSDAPYLLDLQLFLGKRLLTGRTHDQLPNYSEDVVVGSLERERVANSAEGVAKLLDEDIDLANHKMVCERAEKQYMKTRGSASVESARRAKGVVKSRSWTETHPLFEDLKDNNQQEREEMLSIISGFRPQETVFEIGNRGDLSEAGKIAKKRRAMIQAGKGKKRNSDDIRNQITEYDNEIDKPTHKKLSSSNSADDFIENKDEREPFDEAIADMSSVSSDELEVTFSEPHGTYSGGKRNRKTGRDASMYMSYQPAGGSLREERAYGAQTGKGPSDFFTHANEATMDLNPDESSKTFSQPSRVRWDKRAKKYLPVSGSGKGGSGSKKEETATIRGESGARIAASFRSGRFDAWRRENKITKVPRVGESEAPGAYAATGAAGNFGGGRRWRHRSEKAPKEADKYRDDYHKRKKKVAEAKDKGVGRFAPTNIVGGRRNEMKGIGDVVRQRREQARKREKTGRPEGSSKKRQGHKRKRR